MLSYQHGFHAGNKADVLKHAVLDALLTGRPARGNTLYVETHAGRARYDLASKEARQTGEAAQGVLAMLDDGAPRPLATWLDHVKADCPGNYPGSPALAASRLGPTDRMVLFEKHPAEHKALEAAMAGDERLQIKKSDGYGGALKLAPRRGEDMIVFVDPSYETTRDMDALAEWTPRALRRWPRAMLVLWTPLFQDSREAEFGAYLAQLEEGVIAGARWPVDPAAETALEGSAIIAYRVPEAAGSKALAISNALQSHWSKTDA